MEQVIESLIKSGGPIWVVILFIILDKLLPVVRDLITGEQERQKEQQKLKAEQEKRMYELQVRLFEENKQVLELLKDSINSLETSLHEINAVFVAFIHRVQVLETELKERQVNK